MASRLAPDSATVVGLLTAAGVYLIYNNALPSGADVRSAVPHDDDVERSRKVAAWESAALVGMVFLIARDLNSYMISGAALVGIDLFYKHQNAIHPATQKYDVDTSATITPGSAGAYALPDYSEADPLTA